jgi:CheY-like chemotaxis protein
MGNLVRIHPELGGALSAPFGRLVVIERDADLRSMWADVLTEVGYVTDVVDSLGDALLLVEVETYDLALINLYAGSLSTALTPAHVLRRRVAPTPVGLLTTDPLVEEPHSPSPFAFVQALPCDANSLLATIGAAINRPFSPRRRWQQLRVEQFLDALGNDDWPSAPAMLCTEDIACNLPADHAGPPIAEADGRGGASGARRWVYGCEGFSAYLRSAAAHYRRLICFDIHCYALPRGVAARFTYTFESPDGRRHRATGSLIFRFTRRRISRIGVHAAGRASAAGRATGDIGRVGPHGITARRAPRS